MNAGITALYQEEDVNYDPEKLLSYELGVKSTLMDGAMRLMSERFYYDYEDYQAFNVENVVQTIFNADAKVFGGKPS